jgi:hypothetical protein
MEEEGDSNDGSQLDQEEKPRRARSKKTAPCDGGSNGNRSFFSQEEISRLMNSVEPFLGFNPDYLPEKVYVMNLPLKVFSPDPKNWADIKQSTAEKSSSTLLYMFGKIVTRHDLGGPCMVYSNGKKNFLYTEEKKSKVYVLVEDLVSQYFADKVLNMDPNREGYPYDSMYTCSYFKGVRLWFFVMDPSFSLSSGFSNQMEDNRIICAKKRNSAWAKAPSSPWESFRSIISPETLMTPYLFDYIECSAYSSLERMIEEEEVLMNPDIIFSPKTSLAHKLDSSVCKEQSDVRNYFNTNDGVSAYQFEKFPIPGTTFRVLTEFFDPRCLYYSPLPSYLYYNFSRNLQTNRGMLFMIPKEIDDDCGVKKNNVADDEDDDDEDELTKKPKTSIESEETGQEQPNSLSDINDNLYTNHSNISKSILENFMMTTPSEQEKYEEKERGSDSFSVYKQALTDHVISSHEKRRGIFHSMVASEQLEAKNEILKLSRVNQTQKLFIQKEYGNDKEAYCNAMEEFYKEKIRQFWGVFQTSENLAIPTKAAREFFSKMQNEDYFIEINQASTNMSPFANSIIYLISALDQINDLYSTFGTAIMCILSVYSASYSTGYGETECIRPNIALSGNAGEGKSFTMHIVEKYSFPSSVISASHVTMNAFNTGRQETSGFGWIYHETPHFMTGKDHKGNDVMADNSTKTRMSEGINTTFAYHSDENGNRSWKILHNRTIGSNIMLMNQGAPHNNNPIRSRSIWEAICTRKRADTNKNDLSFRTKPSEFTGVIASRVKKEMQTIHFYIFLWNKLIESGVFPPINVSHNSIICQKVFKQMEKKGVTIPESRKMRQQEFFAIAITQYYAVVTEFFSELGLKYRYNKDGTPRRFVITDMLGLLKYSCVPHEATIFCLTLMEHEWISHMEDDLVKTITKGDTKNYRVLDQHGARDTQYIELTCDNKGKDYEALFQEIGTKMPKKQSSDNVRAVVNNMKTTMVKSAPLIERLVPRKVRTEVKIPDPLGTGNYTISDTVEKEEIVTELVEGEEVLIPSVIVDYDNKSRQRISVARVLIDRKRSDFLVESIRELQHKAQPHRKFLIGYPYEDADGVYYQLFQTLDLNRDPKKTLFLDNRFTINNITKATVLNKVTSEDGISHSKSSNDEFYSGDTEIEVNRDMEFDCFNRVWDSIGLKSESEETNSLAIPEIARVLIIHLRENISALSPLKGTDLEYPLGFLKEIKNASSMINPDGDVTTTTTTTTTKKRKTLSDVAVASKIFNNGGDKEFESLDENEEITFGGDTDNKETIDMIDENVCNRLASGIAKSQYLQIPERFLSPYKKPNPPSNKRNKSFVTKKPNNTDEVGISKQITASKQQQQQYNFIV